MDMSRVGACTLGLRMLGLEGALDEIASLGLAGVDLWQVSPYYEHQGHIASSAPPEEVARVRRAVAERGLRLDHLASYPGLMFSADVERDRINDLAWAKESADLCAACGIPVMRVGAGRGESLQHLDTVAPLLKQAADYAAERDVRVALETHPGLPTCRADWTRTILDAVGSDNLGVLYDPANLAAEDGYKDVPRLLGDRIFHVHLKNLHLAEDGRSADGPAAPDDGAADIRWVVRALEDCGYPGAFAIEYESFRENPTVEEARNGLREWAEFLADL